MGEGIGHSFLINHDQGETDGPSPATMRKIRHVLRLTFDQGLSLRQVSSSLSMPYSTVGVNLRRAKAAKLRWPLPDDLDDDELQSDSFRAR